MSTKQKHSKSKKKLTAKQRKQMKKMRKWQREMQKKSEPRIASKNVNNHFPSLSNTNVDEHEYSDNVNSKPNILIFKDRFNKLLHGYYRFVSRKPNRILPSDITSVIKDS